MAPRKKQAEKSPRKSARNAQAASPTEEQEPDRAGSTRNANGKRPAADPPALQGGGRPPKKAKTINNAVKPAATVADPPAPQKTSKVTKKKPVKKRGKSAVLDHSSDDEPEPKVEVQAKATTKGKQSTAPANNPASTEPVNRPKVKPTKTSKKTVARPKEPLDENPAPTPAPTVSKKVKDKTATKVTKPKAVKGTVHAPTTIKGKAPARFSAHRELRIDYTLSGKAHQLITHLQVIKKKPNVCTTTIEAEFRLENLKGALCGEIVAYLIDKTKVSETGKGLAWVSEYLGNGADSEAAHSLKELYTAKGQPRAKVKQYPLAGGNVVYLDSFVLRGVAQGLGISSLAMEAFQKLLPALPAPLKFNGTVVLSPAKPDSEEADAVWKAMSAVEVERVLIGVYRKNGYEVWVKGHEEKAGSVTVMGIVV